MATVETAPSRYERRFLFGWRRWLRRDAVAGVCLCVVLMAGLRLPAWSRVGQSSPTALLAAYLVFYVGVLVCYPVCTIRRRTDGAISLWPGTGRLLKEALIAVPTTVCILAPIGATSYAGGSSRATHRHQQSRGLTLPSIWIAHGRFLSRHGGHGCPRCGRGFLSRVPL